MLVPQMIAAVADRDPDSLAVEIPGAEGRARRRMGFAELVARAGAIAAALAPHVAREDRVLVFVPRHHPDAIAAQLAVWWVGGAFVCPDPRHPDGVLEHLARDSGAVLALTDRAGRGRLRSVVDAAAILDLEKVGPVTQVAAPVALNPDSLAYVLYTSGTTGRPKGVLVEHGGLANLVSSDVARFGLRPGDRCMQGSSLAFDSSLEEIWSPLAGAATVVVADDERVRSGPDLLPWLRGERITVLMPTPTLLRTLGVRDPARDLPDLRLVYTGGEAVPQDVVDLWAEAVWLENGYGPTECTIVCTRGRLQRGVPVTIGRPVPGHEAFVLDPDSLRAVQVGAVGELCIRGPGVARGYLGDPALTARRFVDVPGIGRVYRTGDLARWQGDQLVCLGRADGQVKIRGHRIELEAIESALARATHARAAACRVLGASGRERLVGFVVGPAQLDAAGALSALRRDLPDYMVPESVELLASLPMTANGKLDRLALPEPAATLPSAAAATGAAPRTALERAVARSFARVLGFEDADRGADLGVDLDFFDAGGNSVRAAEAISLLRSEPATAHLAVRDLYRAPTVAGLARLAAEAVAPAPGPRPRPEPDTVGVARPRLVTLLQTLWLWGEAAFAAAGLWLGLFVAAPWALSWTSVPALIAVAPALALAVRWLWALGAAAALVVAKWLVVGRYRELCTPAWSLAFLRFWIVERFARAVPWGQMQGTVLVGVLLRALGARVGRRVHVDRGVDLAAGGWDLLEIGDDASLGRDARLGLVERRAGGVAFSPVRVGARATLEVRAGMDGGSVLGEGASLRPLAALRRGAAVPAGEVWDGVPARPLEDVERADRPGAGGARSDRLPGAAAAFAHGLGVIGRREFQDLVLWAPAVGLGLWVWQVFGVSSERVLPWLRQPFAEPALVAALVALSVVGTLWWVVAQGLALRFLRRVRHGPHARWGPEFGPVWARPQLVERANRWLSGTVFWPAFLRLAGADIGPRCEISTVVGLLPETVSVGGGSFFADGIYLGGARIHDGVVTVAPVRLGASSFVGNHAVIPGGTELPDGVLLGVATVVDPAAVRRDTSWFGHPAFELPRREVVALDRRQTHEPGALQVIRRVLWELLRFALPAASAVAGFAVLAGVGAVGEDPGIAGFLWWLPSVLAAAGAGLAAAVLALKWGLLGRVRPGQHGLWSGWCCRWDFVYVAWGFLAQPVLARFGGTLWLAWYLRAMGTRVGRRVLLGSSFAQVVDPDMLDLGDGVACEAMFQAHSFEDRVLKIDRVRLGDGSTVRAAAVVLYGAEIGEGSEVASHAVVMKRERLLPARFHDGAPTRPVAG